jgi:hypothetical protein
MPENIQTLPCRSTAQGISDGFQTHLPPHYLSTVVVKNGQRALIPEYRMIIVGSGDSG